MHDDFDRCWRAVQSKDARFDGWFFTAVVTTGIYCRPSCPARPPHANNVRFHPTAAAAQQAGFRACKRCRPDASPGSPEWNVRGDVVARAMRLIADGVVDRDGVGALASRLGYSTRHLERLLVAEVGAGPLAIARAQRAQTARLLIETTGLPFGEVAFAAGFSSIRQFNDTVREVFGTSPTHLRDTASRRDAPAVADALTLRLPFRQPLTPDNLFGQLAATAVPGVEEVRDGWYRRSLRLPAGPALVGLAPRADHVACRVRLADVRDLPSAIARCRRLLDLDADPQAIDQALAEDERLAVLVEESPGRRVPRTVDEPEMAIRAVIGQQISTAAARTIAGRLAAAHGAHVDDPEGGLTQLFPTADDLAATDPATWPLPRTRQRCLSELATRIAGGTIELGPGVDWNGARRQLAEINGIGSWTCEIVAMRGLGDPDAFPATDGGVKAALAGLDLTVPDAERWRPWRSYAVQYLWASLDHPINRPLPLTPGTPPRSAA
ncbi:MAG TPA: AlkA N-terminal domain-containing protein [Acidimicrobiales bacterium]|jgi:AraC family transcriptional regulator, regulatory protein of adaptative response / DNA-3-methyladenine glycosylase II|nr:AlkA N-terminal domain-containing protein [Acidimicrobiales bacterium]